MFKDNFERICFEKRISPSSVLEAVGLNRSTYSKWNETTVPRKSTVMKIANELHVDVEDLLRDGTKKMDEPLAEEKQPDDIRTQIGKLLPDLTPDELQQVINYADFLRQKKDRP